MVLLIKSSIIWLSLLLITASSLKDEIELKVRFLNNLLANENVASTVIVKASQWSKTEMVRFSIRIDSTVEFLNANRVINNPLDDRTNTIWFFIDMQSKGSLEFLLNVRHSLLCRNIFLFEISTIFRLILNTVAAHFDGSFLI